MRKQMRPLEFERKRFRGTFVRYGSKWAWDGSGLVTTLLLRDITDVASGRVVADHLWFNLTKGFEALGDLWRGDVIEFDARVKRYSKGYAGLREVDYKLSHPTKICLVDSERKEKCNESNQSEWAGAGPQVDGQNARGAQSRA